MSEQRYLDFEKPVIELDRKIKEMKELATSENIELSKEIKVLEKKRNRLQKEVYSKLTRWQRVQLARHPLRPYCLDLVKLIFTDFIELHGDRGFADDKAMVGGFAKLDDKNIMIIGQQKGRNTKQRQYRNFGSCHPEGYRKALRLIKLAEKFKLPVIIFIDTPGAYPGAGAEERGQAESIARNIREMSVIETPIIIVVIGEGASGGALGIGVGDRIYMLENSWYSVISPEGCAAILWKSPADANPAMLETNRKQAAEALKLTAQDLIELKIIDKIIPEPSGGAHLDYKQTAENIKHELLTTLVELSNYSADELCNKRLEKFRVMGVYNE
ncbi:MAG: acetyl-CoA carboxylase carboxyltransferase subunit alpha [candidate division Zixibacteria bacterium]|nr:acetyl-CoA carboxylase carboxyltransferase subunit alpha [candidate division Zixibacteria bacterium]